MTYAFLSLAGGARGLVFSGALLSAALALGCGSKAAPAATSCDMACLDGVALRSVRTTMKLAFNLTLQGKPVGPQDATVSCPNGGTAHLFGTVASNAIQGATMVDLRYELTDCEYLAKEDHAERNFHLTLTGTLSEKGTLAVQPTATTALVIASSDLTLSGTVYDPPSPYSGSKCVLQVTQDGNDVGGTMCGRAVGFSF